jgi:hypothetical protein
MHAVRVAELDSERALTDEESDIAESETSDARITRPAMHLIWHRCNINHNGLLEEAMDYL